MYNITDLLGTDLPADKDDPWHLPLVLLFLAAVAINSLYMMSRFINLTAAIISTRFFTNDPSAQADTVLFFPGTEPHVTIQICTHNEGRVVEETIARACSIDWPRNKLSIHVLDDSTDPFSIEVANSAVMSWNEKGMDISRRTRPNRNGYKAGNLAFHFESIQSEFVAMLDADHRLERDFLRRTIPLFFDKDGNSRDKIGLVQTPWGYYNMQQNFLTRCDALALDIHHVVEQTGRAALYGCFGFNGTGGVWRKAAIKHGGGWSSDSVTEDVALSYQTFLKGYRFIYLRDMPQQLEVTGNFLAYIQQKHRWTKGFFQVFRQSYWSILVSPKIGVPLKIEAFCHLTASIQYTGLLITLFLYPILVLHGIDGRFVKAAALFPTTVPLVSGIVTCYAKHPGPKGYYRGFRARSSRLAMIFPYIALNAAMSLFLTKAILEGLFSSDTTFLTTPKEGRVPAIMNGRMMKNLFKSANKVKRSSLDDITAVGGLLLGLHQMMFIMVYDFYHPWNDWLEVPFRLLNILLCCSLFWVNTSFLMEKHRWACETSRLLRALRRLFFVLFPPTQDRNTLFSSKDWWNVYFLSKIYFRFRGLLKLTALRNVSFLVWLRLPIPIASNKNLHQYTRAKVIFDVVFGFLLLWRETWFPPLLEVIKFWLNPVTRPTGNAFEMYVQDNLSLPAIAAVAAITLSVLIARKHRIGMTPVIIALFCLVAIRNLAQSLRVPSSTRIMENVAKFHESEALKRVHFPSTPGAPVDIILLHVCSLAWDDLDVVGKKDHEFFDGFDYLFDFNTVTGYSGPSMVRLLRSTCGQQAHGDLYNEAPSECYLMDVLQRLGYETSITMDHDGKYDDFLEEAIKLGHAPASVRPDGLPVEQISFDGSELSDPDAVFDSWLAKRNASDAKRAAVYFNTLILHTGSHWKDEKEWWKNRDPVKEYADRVDRVFRLVKAMSDKVEKAGRSAAIIVVPEHGAALRGSKIQNAQLRDLPLPRITKSFFGVRFIGPGFPKRPASTVKVEGGVSYMAIGEVIANIVKDPVQAGRSLHHKSLTRTPFIAEQTRGTVIYQDGKYLLQADGAWMALESPDLAPADRPKKNV